MLRSYAERVGLKTANWRLTGYPIECGLESEWGTEAGLGEALHAFCIKEGYGFVNIELPEPHDFPQLAFKSMQMLLKMDGREASGMLIEMSASLTRFPVSKDVCYHCGWFLIPGIA